MAQTTVSIELLRQFAQLLSKECESFKQIKGAMDNALESFPWDDPVARKFQTNYEEQLQPLNNKLLPAMTKYENYLKKLAGLTDDYAKNSSPSLEALKQGMAGKGITASDSPSLSAFKAAGIATGVVGIGAMGAAGAGLFKGTDIDETINSISIIDDKEFKDQIKAFEGERKHFYIDTKGKITIGIGNNVHDDKNKFLALDLIDANGKALNDEDKNKLYNKLIEFSATADGQKLKKEKGNNNTIPLKNFENWGFSKEIKISQDAMNRDFDTHLQSSLENIRKKFPDFNTYPPSAQKALLDMEYNIGESFAKEKVDKDKDAWPNLFNAVKKKDWKTAASQCQRKFGIPDKKNAEVERNKVVKAWFEKAPDEVKNNKTV
jgi:GH24 family phage-related lysozyme (muramidase)